VRGSKSGLGGPTAQFAVVSKQKLIKNMPKMRWPGAQPETVTHTYWWEPGSRLKAFKRYYLLIVVETSQEYRS